MRSKLESVWRQTNIKPEELENLLEIPQTMVFVWKYFINLHNKRTASGFSVNPISYSDMYGYFALMQIQPEEWEIDTILKLDSIVMEKYNKEAEEANKPAKKGKK